MIRVLLVDDDPRLCRIMKLMLETEGHYEVSVCHDGKSGLKEARKSPPEAILLDVNMPKMDGLEVLHELGQSDATKYVPVIMLTGDESEETRSRAMYEYAAAYLLKPIDQETLLSTIKRVLNPPIPE